MVNSAEVRSRQVSRSSPNMPSLSAPRRMETYASLPSYSPPRHNWGDGEASLRAKTPAELLGLQVEHKDEEPGVESKLGKPIKVLFASSTDDEEKIFASPKSSPNALRPLRSSSDLDAIGTLKDLGSRPDTGAEAAVAPDALGIFDGLSVSTSPLSQVFSSPSKFSIPTSRKSSLPESVGLETMQGSLSLDRASLELLMENLSGVKMWVTQLVLSWTKTDD